MTTTEMYTKYSEFSACDSYILGFVLDHSVYMVKRAHIPAEVLTVEQASRGAGESLRLRIRRAQKVAFVESGAVCLGSDSILTLDHKNKGEGFEKAVTEYFGQVWAKDTVPFWVQGDIEVNGEQIQIKLDSATLTSTKQLERLAS